MSTKKTVAAIKGSLYGKAESYWAWIIGLNVAFMLFSLLAAVTHWKWLLLAIAVGAILLPIMTTLLKELASGFVTKAERVRRAMILSDSLEKDLPARDQAVIRSWVPQSELVDAAFVPNYFDSKIRPGGARRFSDNLCESAYFTAIYAGRARQGLVGLCVGASVILVIVLAMLASVPMSPDVTLTISKVVIAMVGLFVAGDVASLAWKYWELEMQAERTRDETNNMRNGSPLIEDVFSVFEDYNAVAIQCPPLPTWIHLKMMKEVNKDYRQSHKV